MTWQVSPEEWLLDFTVIPRGRARGGESLDAIDDRLRTMLAPASPKSGIIIPTITAARAAARPPVPAPVPTASSARSETGPAPVEPAAERPGLDIQLQPVGGPASAPTPPPASAGSMVIPSLTRTGGPDEDLDESEALERLTPVGGTEMGIPHDDADDVMSSVAASASLVEASNPDEVEVDTDPEPDPEPVEAAGDSVDVDTEIEDDDTLEVHEEVVVEVPAPRTVEKTAPKPAEKPAPPRPPSAPEKASVAPPRPPEKPAAPKPPEKTPPPPVAADKGGPPKPPPAPVEKPVPPPVAADKGGPPKPPPAPVEKPVPPPVAADKGGPPKPAPPRPPAGAPAATTAPGTKKKRGWHEEAFGDFYPAICPGDTDASADLDVAFVRRCLDLSSGLTLLDVGCGDGRHAAAFAGAGLDVTGLDCSMSQLLRAARRNEVSRFNFDLLHGDMRALPRDRAYDIVTCLGSSLGYFDSEDHNRQCLQDMVEVLKPGGKLVLQVFNRDFLMGVLPCRSWWQGRGCLVLDVADMNFFANRVRIHRTLVFEDGRQFEHHISIRAYTLHDLGRMLGQAGARVLEVSGSRDTRGRFYGAASPDIWIFAQRRDDV